MAGGRPHVVDTLAVESTGANAVIVGGTVGASSGTGGLKGGTISDSVGSMATIRAGGIGIASQAALDLITAASTTQFARIAAGTAFQVPRMNATATAWEFASVSSTLLPVSSSSGTDTTSTATTVATCAITGLTALDSLYVVLSQFSETQNTAVPLIYNSTDSVTINATNAGANMSTGVYNVESYLIRRDQSSTTKIASGGLVYLAATGVTTNALNGNVSTFTTAWTGSWTLGLRHGGVTAGGTYHYSWAVYRILGQ
jgi:hypothetical protein